ncbi:hypothetical protein DFH05DRAFT_97752 [Lentinula detonsa]|uniref:Uncharacterized protein n=1 Tax=Lentinula detonsa TaxID=2804962 RepID=A0A9W8PB12_9AGAR|nr:hypothetical protein DFH05DRAFT_97752 [Lentinula detonsa]
MAAWWSLTSTFLLKFLLIATIIDVRFVYPISLAQDGSSISVSSTQIASPIGQLQTLSDRKSPNDVVFGYIYTVPSSNPKDRHQYYRTTPTPHPHTEPSSPQTANTDHSGQADTLVAGSSTAATPIKGEAGYPRFDDSVTLAAVQRLEALMKTSSYHCYFPGPNYYNAYVPHVRSLYLSLITSSLMICLQSKNYSQVSVDCGFLLQNYQYHQPRSSGQINSTRGAAKDR